MNGSLEVNVIFGGGTQRKATISPGVLSLARGFARTMPSAFEGTGLNPADADFPHIVAITRADHDVIHQIPNAYRKADFRLGQMDLKASVCDMLRAMANGASEQIRPGLILAADLVESMEVSHANS